MSTNLECDIFEFEPGIWYYALERDRFEDEDRFDWLDDARGFGPFGSKDEAHGHLRDHHANPGGHSVIEYDPDYSSARNVIALVSEAPDNMKAYERHSYRSTYRLR